MTIVVLSTLGMMLLWGCFMMLYSKRRKRKRVDKRKQAQRNTKLETQIQIQNQIQNQIQIQTPMQNHIQNQMQCLETQDLQTVLITKVQPRLILLEDVIYLACEEDKLKEVSYFV